MNCFLKKVTSLLLTLTMLGVVMLTNTVLATDKPQINVSTAVSYQSESVQTISAHVSDVPENSEDLGADDEVIPVIAPEFSEEKEEEVIIEHLFHDMAGHWAESFVNDAAKLGLFKGGADGNFNPDNNVTRAQFVTVLYRMAGSPSVGAELPFTDIDNQIPEFKAAITWGYANGYINGTSETTFDPDGTLTREAGMKILHFYSGGNVGAEIQLYGVYDGLLKDSSEISSWAKKSVYWGVYNKLIAGTTADTLSPRGTATRAQLAKILVNYLNIDN